MKIKDKINMSKDNQMLMNQSSLVLDQSVLEILNNSATFFEARQFNSLEEKLQDLTVKKVQLEVVAQIFDRFLERLITLKALNNFNAKECFNEKLHERIEQIKDNHKLTINDPNSSHMSISELLLDCHIDNTYFEEIQTKIGFVNRMFIAKETTLASEIDEEIKHKLIDMANKGYGSKGMTEEQQNFVNISNNTLEKLNIIHNTDEYNQRLQRIEESIKKLTSKSQKTVGAKTLRENFIFEEDRRFDIDELKQSENKLKELKRLLRSSGEADAEGERDDLMISNHTIAGGVTDKKGSDEERMDRVYGIIEDLQKSVTRTADNIQSNRIEHKNRFNSKILMDMYNEILSIKALFGDRTETGNVSRNRLDTGEIKKQIQFRSKSPKYMTQSPTFNDPINNQSVYNINSSQNMTLKEKTRKSRKESQMDHGRMREMVRMVIDELGVQEGYFNTPRTAPFNPNQEPEQYISSELLERTINACLSKFEKNILSCKYIKSSEYTSQTTQNKDVSVIRDWLLKRLTGHEFSEGGVIPEELNESQAEMAEQSFKNELTFRLNNLFLGLVGTDVTYSYLTS